jgi:hypothetical protein
LGVVSAELYDYDDARKKTKEDGCGGKEQIKKRNSQEKPSHRQPRAGPSPSKTGSFGIATRGGKHLGLDGRNGNKSRKWA